MDGPSTYDEFHTYTIDWTQDSITWYIDGKPVRTRLRKDTWNATSKSYDYPQTPSRIQLSLWPGGLASNAEGTIKWAGGLIDWNSQDIKDTGYYYVTVKDITIECYDPPSGAKIEGKKSYIIGDESGLESSVIITDKDYVLKSFLGSGTDMEKDLPASTAYSSGSSEPTEVVETIPGNTGGGTSTNDILSGEVPPNGTTSYDGGDPGSSDNGNTTQQSGFTQELPSVASTFTSSFVAIAIAFAWVFAA